MFDLDFAKPFPANVPANVGGGWWRPTPLGPHYGMDIPTPMNTPILAVASGVVVRAQKTPTPEAGRWVGIRHLSGVTSRYLHLEHVDVDLGHHVQKGQLIGYSGSSGLSETPHLHFDLVAPDSVIPLLEAVVGRPKTGYGTPFNDWGRFVPPDPWLPVDSYRLSTAARDRVNGVVMWRDRMTLRSPLRAPSMTIYLAAGTLTVSAILVAVLLRRHRLALAV